MTERDLLRTALIIPPKGRAVLCVWAAVPKPLRVCQLPQRGSR